MVAWVFVQPGIRMAELSFFFNIREREREREGEGV
jgi:hypothetical protein